MAKKDNKNLITGIIAAVVAVALIVVIVVVVVMSSKKLDESFFVSDDTKYVLEIGSEYGMLEIDEDEYIPEKMYIVYFYSGDDVTGLSAYYEYEDATAAKNALKYFNDEMAEDEQVKKIEANGKYVVVESTEDVYDEMTAEDAKQQVELMKMLQNMNLDDYSTEDEESDVEIDVEEDEE